MLLLLLWLHFFWCLVPSWIDGVYYQYGWLVAPLALFFAWRRWRERVESLRQESVVRGPSSVVDHDECENSCHDPSSGSLTIERLEDAERTPSSTKDHAARHPGEAQRAKRVGEDHAVGTPAKRNERSESGPTTALWLLGLYLLLIVPIRFVEIGDPTWRIPIWVHTLLLLGLTVHTLWCWGGWKGVSWFLPVIVFAMTAVPLPWQVEQKLVRELTGTVTGLTQEWFLLRAVPVERAGETLHLGAEAVEVGDACSGIRSLQGLFMVALFFGELLWLGWGKRIGLIGVACVCAVLTNTVRAGYLAQVQFTKGEAAAAAVHDMAGHLAFAASALILFLSARVMLAGPKKRVVVRTVRA